MKYPIAIEHGNDATAWGVVVPDLPGCFSAGDTIDEAIANAAEAIDGWCELAAESGDEIPSPSAIANHVDNPDYAGWIWVLVDVDISRYQGPAERINVTIPKLVLHRIDEHLKDSPESRSAFFVRVAADFIRHEGKAAATTAKRAQAYPPSGKSKKSGLLLKQGGSASFQKVSKKKPA